MKVKGFHYDEGQEDSDYTNLRDVEFEDGDDIEEIWDYGC